MKNVGQATNINGGRGETNFSNYANDGDILFQQNYSIKHSFVLNRDNIMYRSLGGPATYVGKTNYFLMRSIFGF